MSNVPTLNHYELRKLKTSLSGELITPAYIDATVDAVIQERRKILRAALKRMKMDYESVLREKARLVKVDSIAEMSRLVRAQAKVLECLADDLDLVASAISGSSGDDAPDQFLDLDERKNEA